MKKVLVSHHCKHPLSQGYGMSEPSSASCCFRSFNRAESAGMPMLCCNVDLFDPETPDELGRPADVTFVDALPRTFMGKHDYRALEKLCHNFPFGAR